MYTFEQCKKLELEIGTPAYLVNEDLFLNNLRDIRAAFKSLYQNIVVGYSFKTNYLPYLCKLALEQGCYAQKNQNNKNRPNNNIHNGYIFHLLNTLKKILRK